MVLGHNFPTRNVRKPINTFRAGWFQQFSQKKQQFLVALPML